MTHLFFELIRQFPLHFFRSTLLSFLFDFSDATAVSLRRFYIDSANIISGEFDRLVLNTQWSDRAHLSELFVAVWTIYKGSPRFHSGSVGWVLYRVLRLIHCTVAKSWPNQFLYLADEPMSEWRNWLQHSASRGPSVLAMPLVYFMGSTISDFCILVQFNGLQIRNTTFAYVADCSL